MNKTLTTLALCIGMVITGWAHAEINIVNVRKVEKDLYKTSDGQYIETSACYADADGDKAVLDYEKYACHNLIRFSSDTTCKVEFVFR